VNSKISIDLVKHRLNQAKENLEEAKILYNANKFKGANNRAYYSIFHSIRSILALEPIDFKKHKDVVGYYNKNYIKTEIFPKNMGRKIADATSIREDSDYDDEFVVKKEITESQIQTAEEFINIAEKYIETKI